MTALGMSAFATDVLNHKYAHTLPCGRKETWEEIAHRVAWSVMGGYIGEKWIVQVEKLIRDRKFMPGGRYLYAAGRPYHQISNCFLFRAHDSREGWADLAARSISALMSGGGVGVDYNPIRQEGALVKGLGGQCTGPLSLMKLINESGRNIMQGGSRRSALWARLAWDHPDIFKFIHVKDWPEWLRQRKREDFNTPAPMDGTNISVGLNNKFFKTIDEEDSLASKVYWETLTQALSTAEPGFSIDCGINEGETLRNACTEVTSSDDDDQCNLGSLVLPRFTDLAEFEEAVYLATLFLLCGSQYGHLPYYEVEKVRERNRRLGLGLMGMHEWLLRRGQPYGPNLELSSWLAVYAKSTCFAHEWCKRMSLSPSLKTRAIAPTGTISIVAETTGGIEPIFAVAFLRRYMKDTTWHAQYVIEAAAERLIRDGVDPEMIEDAYDLAEDIERRVAFQAWVQEYVDHGISSTLNLPSWGSSINNEGTVKSFGKMLLKYLPRIRGLTCYPDGCRGGQPLNRVPYSEAVKHIGKIYKTDSEAVIEEYGNEHVCPGGVCGT